MKNILIPAIAATLLVGCGDKFNVENNLATKEEAAVVQPPPKSPYTKKEWQEAFNSVVEQQDQESKGNGTFEYRACIRMLGDSNCDFGFHGQYDGFHKLHHLTPPMAHAISNVFNRVKPYMLAVECKAPLIILEPQVNRNKGGWLFMNKVSFMGDGEVLVEKYFDFTDVNRTNEGSFVHEAAIFVLSYAERKKFASLVKAKEKIIRITGKNEYLTIDKNMNSAFYRELDKLLTATDMIDAAFKKSGGPICDEPPKQ